MNFSELKKSLTTPQKIYLLEGQDAFFRERGVSLLKKAFLIEPDFNYTYFEGSALKGDLAKLIDVLQVYPFLSDNRVVVINEWYPTAQDFKNKELKEFFNSPKDTTILIISNQNKCEQLKKHSSVTFVDCKKGDLSIITKFLQSEAKKNNLTISTQNCELLAEFCLYDMTKINCEIQKVISFCLGGNEITKKHIEDLCNKETDYKIYEVVNFIVQKNTDKALQILYEMIDNGEAQMLLVSLYYHFRKLLHVSLSKQPNSVLAEELGTKEYAIVKAREQARAFSAKRLMKITSKLIEYDELFKSGKILLNNATLNAVFMILTEE